MRKKLRKRGRWKDESSTDQTHSVCEEVTWLVLEHDRVRRLHLVSVMFSGVARVFGTQGD
jgi:hypothetical protein